MPPNTSSESGPSPVVDSEDPNDNNRVPIPARTDTPTDHHDHERNSSRLSKDSEGYPSWLPKRPPPPAPASTLHSSILGGILGEGSPSPVDPADIPPVPSVPPTGYGVGGRKPTPRSVRIVSLQDEAAAAAAGLSTHDRGEGSRSTRTREATDQTRVASSSTSPGVPPKVFTRASGVPRAARGSASAFNPLEENAGLLPLPQPRFNAKNLHVHILRHPSKWMRVYFYLWPVLVFYHIPVQSFLDFNAVFMLLQVAKFPNPGSSGKNWALGAAAYIASWLVWIFVICVVYEFIYSFFRRWRLRRPLILPIYLSAAAFNYTALTGYDTFCFLQHIRWTGFLPEPEPSPSGLLDLPTPTSPAQADFDVSTSPIPDQQQKHHRNDSSSSSVSSESLNERRRLAWTMGFAETCYFYSQNLPTVALLLPRAGLCLALLFQFSSAAPDVGLMSGGFFGGPQGFTRRDETFFRSDGSLTPYARGVLIANAVWTGWRVLVLLISWLGLWILSNQRLGGLCGPRHTWEETTQEKTRSVYSEAASETGYRNSLFYQDGHNSLHRRYSAQVNPNQPPWVPRHRRNNESLDYAGDELAWEWREATRMRVQDAFEICLVARPGSLGPRGGGSLRWSTAVPGVEEDDVPPSAWTYAYRNRRSRQSYSGGYGYGHQHQRSNSSFGRGGHGKRRSSAAHQHGKEITEKDRGDSLDVDDDEEGFEGLEKVLAAVGFPSAAPSPARRGVLRDDLFEAPSSTIPGQPLLQPPPASPSPPGKRKISTTSDASSGASTSEASSDQSPSRSRAQFNFEFPLPYHHDPSTFAPMTEGMTLVPRSQIPTALLASNAAEAAAFELQIDRHPNRDVYRAAAEERRRTGDDFWYPFGYVREVGRDGRMELRPVNRYGVYLAPQPPLPAYRGPSGMTASGSGSGQGPLMSLPYPFLTPGTGRVSSNDLVPFPASASGSKRGSVKGGSSVGSGKGRKKGDGSQKSKSKGSKSSASGSGSEESGSVEEEEEGEEEEEEEGEDEEEEEEEYDEEDVFSTSDGGVTSSGRASESMSSLGQPINSPGRYPFGSRRPPVGAGHGRSLSGVSSGQRSYYSSQGHSHSQSMSSSHGNRSVAGGVSVLSQSTGNQESTDSELGVLLGPSQLGMGVVRERASLSMGSSQQHQHQQPQHPHSPASGRSGSGSSPSPPRPSDSGIPMPPRHPHAQQGGRGRLISSSSVAAATAAMQQQLRDSPLVAFPSVHEQRRRVQSGRGVVVTDPAVLYGSEGMLSDEDVDERHRHGDGEEHQEDGDEDEENRDDREEHDGEHEDHVGLLGVPSSSRPSSLLGATLGIGSRSRASLSQSSSGHDQPGSAARSRQSSFNNASSASSRSRRSSVAPRSRHNSSPHGVTSVRDRANSLGVSIRSFMHGAAAASLTQLDLVMRGATGPAAGLGGTRSGQRSRVNSSMARLEEDEVAEFPPPPVPAMMAEGRRRVTSDVSADMAVSNLRRSLESEGYYSSSGGGTHSRSGSESINNEYTFGRPLRPLPNVVPPEEEEDRLEDEEERMERGSSGSRSSSGHHHPQPAPRTVPIPIPAAPTSLPPAVIGHDEPQSISVSSMTTGSFYSQAPSDRTASPRQPGSSTPDIARARSIEITERRGIDIPWASSSGAHPQQRGLLAPPTQRWVNPAHTTSSDSSSSPADISTAAGSFVTAAATLEGATTTASASSVGGGRTSTAGSWEAGPATVFRTSDTGGMVERPGQDMGATGDAWRLV